jgi:transposase
MDTTVGGRRRKYQRWSEALKREIVAATMTPGASVSVIARRYNVNANQVFGWRRRLGPVLAATPSPAPSPRLVAVTLAPEPAEAAPMPSTPAADMIEIEVGGTYRIRVGATFDCRALQRVLDCLGRAGGARGACVVGTRERRR